MSTTLSIDVENCLKKNNKKHLTNSNQCGLSFFFKTSKKLAQIFYSYLNTVFITFCDKNSLKFINFAVCLHPVNKVVKQL